MMKHKFSSSELAAIHNSKFFQTKASVSFKIDSLLAETRDRIKLIIEKEKIIFPEGVDAINGKIFRGENYLGLPYLVLDYPKYFGKDSAIAFRSMFWWGKFFSCTLHLQGKALEEKREMLIKNIKNFRKKKIFICTHHTPWQYYYKKDNYSSIDKFSDTELKKIFSEKEFVKLSRKIELKDYKMLPGFAAATFKILCGNLFH